MSHVAAIDLKVTDIEAAKLAFEACGMELREQAQYAWWGTSVGDYAIPAGLKVEDLGKCQYAARVNGTTPVSGPYGPWEIGLVPRRDGGPGWELMYDFFGAPGRALEAAAGSKLTKFKVEYASAVAIRQLARQGYRVKSTVNAQGQRQIVGVKA